MMKKILAMALSVMVVTLTACGGGTANVEEQAATLTADGQSAALDGQSGDAPLIGIAMPTRTAERWIYEGEQMEALLKAAGYQVILQFANDDVTTQVSQIENMITNGARFLIICPIDGSSLSGPLATARAQGIGILAYDRLIMDTADVDFFVGFNSERIGNHMGESLMTGIGAANATPDDPLFIELFAGSLDDSNTTYYFHGALDMIQPYLDSGVVVVKSGQVTMEQAATPGWDSVRARERMENLLAAHYTNDTLAGALSPYDGLSLGIIAALSAVGYGTPGRPMPVVTGQDAELPSLISIWNDEQYSTIFLDFDLLVHTAVDTAIGVLSGNPPAKTKDYNNNVIDVPAFLADAYALTKANLPELIFDRGIYTADDLQVS